MAIRMRDGAAIAKKYRERASNASGDYKTGVEGAGQDWAARTGGAGEVYAQGVTAAIGRKAFEKGITSDAATRYQKRAAEMGPSRYQQGVGAAESDYQRGSAPYQDALRNMDLPPRGPRRSQQNQNRQNAVVQRLSAIKEGR